MQRIEKTGYQHSNLLVYSILTTLDDILGTNGLTTILKYAGLTEYINNYPPPNLTPGPDFADTTSLFIAVEDIYGARGSHALLVRAGKKGLEAYREKFGPMMSFVELELKLVPRDKWTKHALDFLMKLLTRTGNQKFSSFEAGNELIYQVSNCASCFGRPQTDHAVCYMTVGALQGILHWVSSGHDFQIKESLCIAKGDPFCEYRISTVPNIST